MSRRKKENHSNSGARVKNHARTTWLASIGILGLLMLFSHQNCAPTGHSVANAANGAGLVGAPSAPDAPVSIIDESKSAMHVSFSAKAVEIHAQANEVQLDGLCGVNQEGSVLAWHANAINSDGSEGSEFARGFADCSAGVFKVQLSPTQDLACDQKYQVTARLGLGAAGEVVLTRRCAAANIADGTSFKAAVVPAGTDASCVLEKSSPSSCSVVCYSEDGVVRGEKSLDANSCSI
jgi:hypothetical protein